MRTLPSLVVTLLLFASSASAAEPPAPATLPATAPAVRVRVATYNINYAVREPRDLDVVVQTIREAKADLVAIQEGNGVLYATLRKALAKEFPHMQFYPGAWASGSGWLSKFPLKKMRVLPRAGGPFETPLAQVEIGGRVVELVNVHLQPTNIPGGAAVTLRAFFQFEPIREKEIRFILSKVPAGAPALVIGDMNTFLRAVDELKRAGFTDSFLAANTEPQSTWRWEMDGKTHTFRLDFVFHSAHFTTLSSRVIKSEPSDHYRVVSEREFGDTAAAPAATPATRPVTP